MTIDGTEKTSNEAYAAENSAKQRRKRKWDQPAESLVVPGVLPFAIGAVPGMNCLPVNPTIPVTLVTAPQSLLQNAAAVVQKLNLPKIQDELIAREIVINNAESAIRYKLTKRQTQEEIQRCTGAVVITRGKYHPLNGLPENEKPLYLHISAGSHLKDTAERIKVVDQAAAIVEEILKKGHSSQLASAMFGTASDGLAAQSLSTCVFLGFDPDPSLNVAARICGPNDQYINHIMNETGATVVLRGRGSGNHESCLAEETQQPLHLYITSTTSKSLEAARALAENLFDTISAACGVSRHVFSHPAQSSKVYNAVPPPQQLLSGVASSNPGSTSVSMPAPSFAAVNGVAMPSPGANQPVPPFNYGDSQSNICSPAVPSISSSTCYSGYSGIYPQATPLQQVAQVLRQATASTSSVASTSLTQTLPKTSLSSNIETEKNAPQRRKFQELPATLKGPATPYQVFSLTLSEADRLGLPSRVGVRLQNCQQGHQIHGPALEFPDVKSVSSMPLPRKFIPPCANGMPPPPGIMPPPPPPPKFSSPPQIPSKDDNGYTAKKSMPPPPPKFSTTELPSKDENMYSTTKIIPPPPKFIPLSTAKLDNGLPLSQSISKSDTGNSVMKKSSSKPVSGTLLKLVEYGEEDDDADSVDEDQK